MGNATTGSQGSTKASADTTPAIGVLEDDEFFVGTAQFTDAEGEPVALSQLNGAPAWSSDDPTTVSVSPSEDGGSCTINGLKPTGKNDDGSPKTVLVHCIGTNPDGTTAELLGAIQVLSGDAVGGGMSFGAAQKRTS